MKNSVSHSMAIVAGLLIASPVAAEEMMSDFYLGVSGVGSIASDVDFDSGEGSAVKHNASFDPGYGALVRGGYDFGDLRAELEVGYRNLDVNNISPGSNESGELNLYTTMVNVAWDIEMDSSVTPYVSIGLGAAFAEGDVSYTTTNGSTQVKNYFGVAPNGQIGLGLGYSLDESIDFIGGYSLSAAPTDDTNEDEVVLVHSVQLGLNFGF